MRAGLHWWLSLPCPAPRLFLTCPVSFPKARLTCPCCNMRKKDAVLTKCFHVFCFECVKTRYDTRQRKCPKCNAAFGANDFHRIYIGWVWPDVGPTTPRRLSLTNSQQAGYCFSLSATFVPILFLKDSSKMGVAFCRLSPPLSAFFGGLRTSNQPSFIACAYWRRLLQTNTSDSVVDTKYICQ